MGARRYHGGITRGSVQPDRPAAAIPAVLYLHRRYFSVHLEACRAGLAGLPPGEGAGLLGAAPAPRLPPLAAGRHDVLLAIEHAMRARRASASRRRLVVSFVRWRHRLGLGNTAGLRTARPAMVPVAWLARPRGQSPASSPSPESDSSWPSLIRSPLRGHLFVGPSSSPWCGA